MSTDTTDNNYHVSQFNKTGWNNYWEQANYNCDVAYCLTGVLTVYT